MTAAELRKRMQEAPERYRDALAEALTDVDVEVSYSDDERAIHVVCTRAKRRRLTWQFDAAEVAAARNPEKYFVETMCTFWES